MTPDSAARSQRRAPTGRPPVVCVRAQPASARRRLGRCGWALIGALAQLLPCLPARADHAAAFYPSFYPQEIRIETLDRGAAIAGWSEARVHAYVGDDLFAETAVPGDATSVTSLRSLLVLTFDAPSGAYDGEKGKAARCRAAASILPRLGRTGYVFHPYPVTPYHADFLEQADLAEAARARYARPTSADAVGPRVRPQGKVADSIVPTALVEREHPDAALEEIDVERLADTSSISHSGEAPWGKQGWYQAYRLYTERAAAPSRAARMFERLARGAYRDAVERINLERALTAALAGECRRVVVGYTLRREYFNSEYARGVENVGFDSQHGLTSAIFPRTVKLKDFPWNGWLRVGVASAPGAAWNPVAGFGDAFGRMLWAAVADPAQLSDPHGGGWIANRASVVTSSGPVSIPADALRPELGSGRLRAVGAGKVARERLRYKLVTSAFHDGARGDVADLIYPYIFAFRWDDTRRPDDAAFDPVVGRSGARLREWLAGFRLVGIEAQTRNYGDDLKYSYRVPVIEVYLNHGSDDSTEAAAVAAPWSTLPWDVIVLMEEAVERGIAAFSLGESTRRGLPWLDLVRDPVVAAKLASLVDEFAQTAYRPEPLRSLVSEQDARERWTALGRFYSQHHHFLVTNGPFRLVAWDAGSATLSVFRDSTYPLGVGAFDAYAVPLWARAVDIEDRGDSLVFRAEVERIVRAQRSYEIERARFVPTIDDPEEGGPPRCRYVIVGPGAQVVRAGGAGFDRNGRFRVDLSHLGAPGRYTVAAAVFVGGNAMRPDVSFVQHRVQGRAAPRARAAAPD